MPEASRDVPPKARKLGLAIPLGIAIALFVIVAIVSFMRIGGADTSGPVAQGAENLVGAGTAQESSEAVTTEAPIAGTANEQPSSTPGGQAGNNP